MNNCPFFSKRKIVNFFLNKELSIFFATFAYNFSFKFFDFFFVFLSLKLNVFSMIFLCYDEND